MSFELIRQAWNTPCQSHTQKVVLAALACAANELGECWPSIETLMRRCDLTRRAVQTQIRSLKDDGLLAIKDGGGKHVSNRYILKLSNSAQDTLNGKRRMGYSVSDSAIQRTPRTKQRIRCAPSASISQEQPGGGKPPCDLPEKNGKYVRELEAQIHRAEERIEKLKAQSPYTETQSREVKSLRVKIEQWEREVLEK